MISNFVDLNKEGTPAKRNEIGVFKERIYGMSWDYDNESLQVVYEYPITPSVLEHDDIICVNRFRCSDELTLLNGFGEAITTVVAKDAFDSLKDLSLTEEEILRAQFAYPDVCNDNFQGFYMIAGKNEYRVEFDLKTLEFGEVKRTRM
jgi:hypothetical protein